MVWKQEGIALGWKLGKDNINMIKEADGSKIHNVFQVWYCNPISN